NGHYKRLAQLVFDYDAFFYSAEPQRFSVYVRTGGGEGGFTRYRVSSVGFEELNEAYGSLAEEQERVAQWKKSGRPKLYWTNLAELRTSSTPVWHDADDGSPAPSQPLATLLVDP